MIMTLITQEFIARTLNFIDFKVRLKSDLND